MNRFSSNKMKRKELDEAYDEFFEFSLNSPAQKIRRLDAEIPPVAEENPAIQFPPEQQMSELSPEIIDSELRVNEERAIVLYNPADSPFEANYSIRVDSKLINGLKNRAFWPSNPNPVRIEEIPMEGNQNASTNSLAVIPWIASQPSETNQTAETNMYVEEPMEAEEVCGDASMDIEQEMDQVSHSNINDNGNCSVMGENMHSWLNHCLIPGPPQNNSTPVMWSWQ